jgi:hypothetical protein
MSRRKQPGAWQQALINQQFTELVFVIGWMDSKTLLTDSYRITSPAGKLLTIDALAPFVTPGKDLLAYRGMKGDDIGFIVFHPYITDEIRSYVHELINKNYPLEDHTELTVTNGHVIVDLDELDEIKPQDGGVN